MGVAWEPGTLTHVITPNSADGSDFEERGYSGAVALEGLVSI
jgi:hypothetical protein